MSDTKKVEKHVSEEGTLTESDDGFYRARCMCGFERGPLPDLETVVDVLMEHAAYVAEEAAKQ